MSFKKVIIIGPAHPLRGGIASTNERLAKELMDDGYDVEIHSFSVQYPKMLFPGKTQYHSGPPPKSLKITSDINSMNPFNWFSAGRRIRKKMPDLVIVRYWIPFMGPSLGTILRRIRRNKHTKIIGIFDNVIPHERRPGDKVFTRFVIKPIDAFIAMSRQVLKDLSQFDTKKERAYTPHPLFDNYGEKVSRDQALKNLGLDQNTNYILFFGLIRGYKGLDLLLKAFGDQRFRGKKIKLIIAGEFYDKQEKYNDLIEALRLGDDIIMMDRFIPTEELPDLFCGVDMICQPYKTATQSGVTQIAYHFEIPMLVTNVGGLPEIVPDGKVGYVTSQDPGDIANKIIEFYEQSKKEEFVENIKEEKKRFDWARMVETIETLYEKIQ